ncbi:hypothetical protein IJI31_02970 [bacterium]|nr:hypothetical protein [bacterium]
MKINSIQFNFIQNRPQRAVTCPLCMNNSLSADTVSFSGKSDEEDESKKIDDLKPKHKGIIYKKVRDKDGKIIKVPQEVKIIKRSGGTFDFKDGKELIGYARLEYIPASHCQKDSMYYDDYTTKNYEDLGIKNDRIEVEYVKNFDEKRYGGIGHLADLIEVAACKELGFEPNVVSVSVPSAAPLHYMRGKRFVPYDRYLDEFEMKKYDLEGENPNDTIKGIIENKPEKGGFDTSSLGFELLMYMPKDMIKELEEELKEHPIF